jgi:hypothetical protein
MKADVFGDKETIVNRRRKRMLGGEAIVDGEHRAARACRELPAQDIVGIQVADRPASAMEEDERGQGLVRRRAIHADGDLLAEDDEAGLRDWRRLRGKRGPGVAIDPPRDEGGHRVVGRERRARHALEQRRNLYM